MSHIEEVGEPEETVDAIAIIGIAGRFPGAQNPAEFWQNLIDGIESICTYTEEELIEAGIDPDMVRHPNYVKASGSLTDVELFDAPFFGFTPREAQITDPQHRLFLECAWEALEDAGYVGETYPGVIGVYAGSNMNTYLLNNIYSRPDIIRAVGDYPISVNNGADFLCTRVSYKLNLRGPSMTVQTGCSTGLVAASLGCQSLLNYQTDMVLAGGVSVWAQQKTGYFYQEGGISSPDGHCRAFDAKANGTVMGNGAGVLLLKRLQDAVDDGDHIYAIIRGIATNNDGNLKVGFTAPSVEGQAEAIMLAQGLAEVEPDSIDYIEAHGTGTAIGDPIEITALTQAFRAGTDKTQFCAIGSVKTNVGHLDSAAGSAGLIKTALALKHQQIPPSLHFETPNPQIPFADSPFFVNNTPRPWPRTDHPRRAGVSSFGIGGTNAHAVLEEAPERPSLPAPRPFYPLPLAARTPAALAAAKKRLAVHLQQHPDLPLADVAYTLLVGRKPFAHRALIVAHSLEDAGQQLLDESAGQTAEASHQPRPFVFMFSGQGSQYVNMGWQLYASEPLFQETVDQCAALLEPHLGLSLVDLLYPSDDKVSEASDQLDQTQFTQPALFTIEYALAKLWQSWGIQPDALVGHSIGEYVAACLAGVFSLEDALWLVAKRGQLMQAMVPGVMLSVPLPEADLRPLLSDSLSLAVINGPANCVLSGSEEAITAITAHLANQGTAVRRLHTSHAFHSYMMEPMLAEFTQAVSQVARHEPQIPCLSNVTGDWLSHEQAQDPAYWADQLRHTVRFADNVQTIADQGDWIWLEVGPGHTLRSLAQRQLAGTGKQLLLSSLPHPQANDAQDDYRFLLQTWGRLWMEGALTDAAALYAAEPRYRVPLPTYPFERQRHWLDPRPRPTADFSATAVTNEHNDSNGHAPLHPQDNQTAVTPQSENGVEQTLRHIWQNLIGVDKIGPHDNFFELGGDSLMSLQVAAQAKAAGFDLSPATLFKYPTLAELTAVVLPPIVTQDGQQTAVATQFTSRFLSQPFPLVERRANLVQIQAGGNKPPLFLVHSATGDVLSYRRLAHHLGTDQPVYGFVASGLYDDQPPIKNFSRMALKYVRDMLAIQPKGPYYLAGWSAGGTLAFEMALQLQKLNKEASFLGLIDAGMGNNQQNLMRLSQGLLQASHWAERLYQSGSFGQKLFYGGVKRLWRLRQDDIRQQLELHNHVAVLMLCLNWLEEEQGTLLDIELEKLHKLSEEAQFEYVGQQMQAAGFTAVDELLAGIRRWVAVTLTNSELVDAYQPEPYNGRLTFFRASEVVPNEKELVNEFIDNDTLGWADHCTQPIVVHKLPGHHYVLLDEPHVSTLASLFKEALAEAQMEQTR